MKTLKKWALRAWRVVLWLPWVFTKAIYIIFGILLTFLYCIAGQERYANRLIDSLFKNS